MKQTHWINAGLPVAAVGMAITLFACSGDIPSSPTDTPPPPPPPSDAIQDALNGQGGNPFVFLKPPVVNEPDPALFGTFDPGLEPVVEICELDAAGLCANLLRTNDGTNMDANYTVDGGPGGESITVDLTEEEYQVEIHFSLFDLVEGGEYRILTRRGGRILAYADVILVSAKEMKNADSDNNIVFTNDQKTVPWKVRIDDGALCWEPGQTVASCTYSTVTAGQEQTVTLTSSDGEEVDFHLPSGWTATVNGQTVDELTISIGELAAIHGTTNDPSCFANFLLADPATGEPSNCYDVQAHTDTRSDVTVEFGGSSFPILAFCPDQQVLQAIANGEEGYVLTSVEQDAQAAVRRTYRRVNPASDFGGCSLPQTAFGDGLMGQFATLVWQGLRPVMKPLLPTPLYAVDLGFGGELTTLGTIFFWGRTALDMGVSPSSTTVSAGGMTQLTVEPIYYHGDTNGTAVSVQWSSSNPNVATVDGTGLVTGESEGTAEITATATDVLDSSGNFLTALATVTVAEADPAIFSASFETETIGQAPTTPEIGTWTTSVDDGAGSITVQSGLGDMTGNVVVIERTGSLGLILAGNVAGTPPSSGTWVAKWKYVVATDPSASIFGPVVFRGNGGIIGSVEFRSNNQITLNSNDTNQGDVVGTWTQNVSQAFEFLIDFDNKATSLKIDGVTVATERAFPQAATTLDRIAVEVGFTTAQTFGWDDVIIEMYAPIQ